MDSALAGMQGRKFIVFNGKVIPLDTVLRMDVSDANGLLYLEVVTQGGVSQGKALLADMTGLIQRQVCDANASWYQYLYCSLDNLSKSTPGALLGNDTFLKDGIKSYLDRRFAQQGGFDANFEISSDQTYIMVSPKAVNNLTGLDGTVSLAFNNDPMIYDKNVTLAYWSDLRDQVMNETEGTFYVVGNGTFEPVTYAEIDALAAQNATAVPAQSPQLQAGFSPPGSSSWCYKLQSGSVIPCNPTIDWVNSRNGFGNLPLFAPFKPLAILGYKFNPIDAKTYPEDSFGFLKAVVASRGQVMLHNFHKQTSGRGDQPSAGFISPFGCVSGNRIKDGSFVKDLNSLGIFKRTLTAQDVYSEYFPPACGVSKFCWGIRLTDTVMEKKAIQAGYMCHGFSSQADAIAHYLTIEKSMSGPTTAADMKLFTKYLMGIGPDPKFYTAYPPRLRRWPNSDISSIFEYAGPGCGNCVYRCFETGLGGAYIELAGTSGIERVQIPMRTQGDDGKVHLFPYITSLSLGHPGAVSFSDALKGPPTLGVKIPAGNVAAPNATSTDNTTFSFSMPPEVQVIGSNEYDWYHSMNKTRDIPIGEVFVSGAAARFNGIQMVGNPLAANTANDRKYNQPYFINDQYFWDYSGRAEGKDINTFKARFSFRQHPYVSSVGYGEDHRTVVIDFSSDIQGVTGGNAGVVTVDASACSSCGSAFAEGGQPKYLGTDKSAREVQFTLKDCIQLKLGSDVPSDWQYAAKVTVSADTKSYPNKLPLLGNTRSASKWSYDRDGDGIEDAWEGNSNEFPQVFGAFEIWIPCEHDTCPCQTGTGTGTGTDTETDTETVTDTVTDTSTSTDTGTKTHTGTNTGTGTSTGTGTQTGTGTGTHTGTSTGTGTGSDTDTGTLTIVTTHTHTGTYTGTNTSTLTETNTGTDTKTDTDTGTETRTNTKTDTNTGTDTKTDTDTGTDTGTATVCGECTVGDTGCTSCGCFDRSDNDLCNINVCKDGSCGVETKQCPEGRHCDSGNGDCVADETPTETNTGTGTGTATGTGSDTGTGTGTDSGTDTGTGTGTGSSSRPNAGMNILL